MGEQHKTAQLSSALVIVVICEAIQQMEDASTLCNSVFQINRESLEKKTSTMKVGIQTSEILNY